MTQPIGRLILPSRNTPCFPQKPDASRPSVKPSTARSQLPQQPLSSGGYGNVDTAPGEHRDVATDYCNIDPNETIYQSERHYYSEIDDYAVGKTPTTPFVPPLPNRKGPDDKAKPSSIPPPRPEQPAPIRSKRRSVSSPESGIYQNLRTQAEQSSEDASIYGNLPERDQAPQNIATAPRTSQEPQGESFYANITRPAVPTRKTQPTVEEGTYNNITRPPVPARPTQPQTDNVYGNIAPSVPTRVTPPQGDHMYGNAPPSVPRRLQGDHTYGNAPPSVPWRPHGDGIYENKPPAVPGRRKADTGNVYQNPPPVLPRPQTYDDDEHVYKNLPPRSEQPASEYQNLPPRPSENPPSSAYETRPQRPEYDPSSPSLYVNVPPRPSEKPPKSIYHIEQPPPRPSEKPPSSSIYQNVPPRPTERPPSSSVYQTAPPRPTEKPPRSIYATEPERPPYDPPSSSGYVNVPPRPTEKPPTSIYHMEQPPPRPSEKPPSSSIYQTAPPRPTEKPPSSIYQNAPPRPTEKPPTSSVYQTAPPRPTEKPPSSIYATGPPRPSYNPPSSSVYVNVPPRPSERPPSSSAYQGMPSEFVDTPPPATTSFHDTEQRTPVAHTLMDPLIGSSSITGLNRNTFKDFLSSRDAAMVMFYHPSDGKFKQFRDQFVQASTMTFRQNQAMASVNCSKEHELCATEHISSYPVFKFYSQGVTIKSFRGHDMLTAAKMKEFIDDINHY
ncbi:hypothetical protein BsWGS_17023 [Bradybaena similaris]